MFNIILDALPEDYEGYLIRTDFRIYLQICECIADDELSDEERISTALWLLYGKSQPPLETAYKGLLWYLHITDEPYSPEENESKNSEPCISFEIDAGRIYTAFRRFYGINLNTEKMHWIEFLYKLKDMGECAYTTVAEIRSKSLKGMGKEQKKEVAKLKERYSLKELQPRLSQEQRKQIEYIKSLYKEGG